MSNKTEIVINNKSGALNVVSWLFGIVFLIIGLVNTLWGNDPGFGVFIVLLSFIYFRPANTIIRQMTGLSVPGILKILIGIFIIWAALGVGELFDKIDLMKMDLFGK